MLRRALLICFLLALSIAPAYAGYEEGEAAYQRKDWPRAIAELRPAAEAGDSRALFTLGKMYLEGSGVIADPNEALSLYARAAALGNSLAMISIGSMYSEGLGLKRNPQLAAAWFLRAAELGDQLAAFFAGLLLFKGDAANPTAFAQDVPGAYKWLTIAMGGNVYPRVADAAKAARGAVANRLSPMDRAAAEKDALAWRPKTLRDLGPAPSDKSK